MNQIFLITFKGIFRDRVFRGIAISAIFFLLIPTISSLSMRQVVELSISLSLSLISFMMLLLCVFLGGSSLWKDMERRYSLSVLGLPVSRSKYLLGKFFGIAGFMILTTLVLGTVAAAVIKYISILYPPIRMIVWPNVLFSVVFIVLKYILLVAFAFLLSTVSTSFFLPIFGTLSIYLVGSATQQVYDFIRSPSAVHYSPLIKNAVTVFYYVMPNLTAFDFSVNAAYGIDITTGGLVYTTCYFIVYTGLVLSAACIIFSGREMK